MSEFLLSALGLIILIFIIGGVIICQIVLVDMFLVDGRVTKLLKLKCNKYLDKIEGTQQQIDEQIDKLHK